MWLRLLSVYLVICTAVSVSSHAMGRLCGRELADTLDIVCFGRGFHWVVNKRSGIPGVTTRAGRHRRDVAMRGIVDECCYHACSVSVLERYCARPASHTLLSILENHLRRQFWPIERDDSDLTTLPSSTPAVISPPALTSQFASKPRKFHSFFYLHLGRFRARSPLI